MTLFKLLIAKELIEEMRGIRMPSGKYKRCVKKLKKKKGIKNPYAVCKSAIYKKK